MPPFLFNFHPMKTQLEIVKIFFKLGSVAFGGPAAHIAMMEKEIVEKRKWLTQEHFLDLMGVTNLIPGPNSTEMTMHCGYVRGGLLGLILAGLSFILPAVLITSVFGWFYLTYGDLPNVAPFLAGIKPAVIAIICGALWKLGQKAVKNVRLAVLGITVLAAAYLGVSEIIVLFTAGILGMLIFATWDSMKPKMNGLFILPLTSAAITQMGTMKIFLTFLKVGSLLYGGGYVLFAYLDQELVTTGLMSREQLMDAVAVGQFTPGPVLSTATFIGYQLNGIWGAVAATVGIFLPSFVFVFLIHPFIKKLRSSSYLKYFLDAVNVAALGVMLNVTISMSIDSIIDWRTTLILILSGVLVFQFKKISSVWIVVGASFLGYGLNLI